MEITVAELAEHDEAHQGLAEHDDGQPVIETVRAIRKGAEKQRRGR